MSIDRIAKDFFVGTEVENSPAKGMTTLFVVGLKPADQILEMAIKQNIFHVYLGANMSMHHLGNNDHDEWIKWDNLIDQLLDDQYLRYITVDIDVRQTEGFLESRASENNRVIPMISVKLPYSKLLNYNTTVKIDDIGFDKTNPGVWCWPLSDLLDRSRFTSWYDYKDDKPL